MYWINIEGKQTKQPDTSFIYNMEAKVEGMQLEERKKYGIIKHWTEVYQREREIFRSKLQFPFQSWNWLLYVDEAVKKVKQK